MAEYVVSHTGSDANPGSESQPFRSLARALASAGEPSSRCSTWRFGGPSR